MVSEPGADGPWIALQRGRLFGRQTARLLNKPGMANQDGMWKRRLAPAAAPNQTKRMMKKSVKNRLWIGLVSAMGGVLAHAAWAQDAAVSVSPAEQTSRRASASASAPAPSSRSPAEQGASSVVTGKIVVVDKTARTITLQVGDKLQMLTVGSAVKMISQGRLIAFSDLAVGQEVSVLTKQSVGGRVQVVALRVEASKAPTEAAGAGVVATGGGVTHGSTQRPADAPFATLPNSANNLAPVISPER